MSQQTNETYQDRLWNLRVGLVDGGLYHVLAEGDIPAAQGMLDRRYGVGVVRIERGAVTPA